MMRYAALAMTFAALWSFVANEAKAEFSINCPEEGLFSAPPKLLGDMPNPSAGWDLFLDEAMPQKIELLPPPNGGEGSWLITCYVNVRGGLIALNARVSGTRVCSLSADGGVVTALPNGGQSCLFGESGKVGMPRNSCSVNCR
jgi:hypothetical protein